jgi:hypothetical protein
MHVWLCHECVGYEVLARRYTTRVYTMIYTGWGHVTDLNKSVSERAQGLPHPARQPYWYV